MKLCIFTVSTIPINAFLFRSELLIMGENSHYVCRYSNYVLQLIPEHFKNRNLTSLGASQNSDEITSSFYSHAAVCLTYKSYAFIHLECVQSRSHLDKLILTF
jgi:hypothetical protein